MKKIVLLIALAMPLMAQISTLQLPFRVVSVSPNYPNIYPRYKTLQATYLGIRDSASVSTGKYFVVNIVTSYNNVTDYTSAWKDSIVNRNPYMKLTSFGQAINDSIIGITTQEFTLIAGILGLNPLTAGDGLTFSSNKYAIQVQNYLGNALWLNGDSLQLRIQPPIYFTPNLLGLLRSQNSGLYGTDSLKILNQTGGFLYNNGDTLKQRLSFYFLPYDSLTLDWNTQHFNLTYGVSPAINVKLDSGLTASADGIRAWTDNVRLGYTSGKRITIPDAIAGQGLDWFSDVLTVNISAPLAYVNDTVTLNYSTDQFQVVGGALYLNPDSGLIADNFPTPSAPKVSLDHITTMFTALGEIQVSSAIAGLGLTMISGIINIVPNEFAQLENDTLKIKTSYSLIFYADSLTSNITSTGIGIAPYDSTGIPVIADGKIKRITYTYQLASGNDTVVTTLNNVAVSNATDKIRLGWTSGLSQMSVHKWTLATRTWTSVIDLDFTGYAGMEWRVIIEMIAEAQ